MATINVKTGPLGDLFFEETEVTRYVALAETAGGFAVPNGGINDRHFQDINAPGLVVGRVPVILYRTRNTGRPSFQLRLNSTVLTQFTFPDEEGRSFHELIPAGALKVEKNELVFSVSGSGSVVFGDVVIFYTSNELTVKKPIVLTQG